MPKRGSDSGRYAVIWLATAYTVFIGIAPLVVVIVVAAEKPELQLAVMGIVIALATIFLLIKLIPWDGPVNRLKYWLNAHDRSDPTDIYRAARRRIKKREDDEFGSNQPPTLDSIRDAANHGGAWVPRSSSTRRPPKR